MPEESIQKDSAEKSEFELQKHKIWEHVEERLDKRTSRLRSSFVFAIMLLGVLGIPSLFFTLKISTVNSVKTSIEKETATLRQSLMEEMDQLKLTI